MILWLMGLLSYKINRTKLLILTTISIIWTILFVGTYVDSHGDNELLIKYKPTFKFEFYSPVYHYRLDSTKVFTEIELKEEKLYQEFVRSERSITLHVFTYINLQLCFTFLCALLLDIKYKNDISIIQLLIHVVFCNLFTIFSFKILIYYFELFNFYTFYFILFLIFLAFIVLINLIILLFINKFKVIMNFVVNLILKVF